LPSGLKYKKRYVPGQTGRFSNPCPNRYDDLLVTGVLLDCADARIKWVSSSDAAAEVLYETREDLLRDVGDFGFGYFAKGDSFEGTDGVLAI